MTVLFSLLIFRFAMGNIIFITMAEGSLNYVEEGCYGNVQARIKFRKSRIEHISVGVYNQLKLHLLEKLELINLNLSI